MAIESFNETFLGNADVPETGSRAGADRAAGYQMRATATGMPKGVQSFDPASNMGTPTTVKMATRSNPASPANAKFRPSAVDHFSGENT